MKNNLKICTKCLEGKELSEFYSQKKKKANGDEYIYYNPECKECAIKRATKRQESIDREIKRAYYRQYDKSEKRKKIKGDYSRKQKENGYYKSWQQENPNRISGYNTKRNMHKKHEISDEEWFACLDYFNNCCAYCGLSEEMQIKLYEEQFHKEHVVHNGSNYIDNCVPSCTSCNTSKNVSEFNDWYNEHNDKFSKRRLNKIINWMTKECLKILNLQ